MRINNQQLAELRPSAENPAENPVDFGFLAAQTFNDADLEREVLELFLAQAARVVASLPGLGPRDQVEAVHLLKGSAQGIGAWRAAQTAAAFERADAAVRPARLVDLAAAYAEAQAAIRAHLDRRPA